jgi:hypothetical protein
MPENFVMLIALSFRHFDETSLKQTPMERATGQRDFGVQELPNRGTDLASGVVGGFFSRWPKDSVGFQGCNCAAIPSYNS